VIDPDGPMRPLRPRPPPPPPKAGDTLAAEAARRIKRDAALVRAIEILGHDQPRY
jgi:hypothetical protein